MVQKHVFTRARRATYPAEMIMRNLSRCMMPVNFIIIMPQNSIRQFTESVFTCENPAESAPNPRFCMRRLRGSGWTNGSSGGGSDNFLGSDDTDGESGENSKEMSRLRISGKDDPREWRFNTFTCFWGSERKEKANGKP
jgi:hypothetical protein